MIDDIAIRDTVAGVPGPWVTLDVDHYPAGEPYVKDVPDGLEYGFDILVRTANIGTLIEALFFVDAMRWRYGDILIGLHLPHFPGARQDRLNSDGDLLFTAKSVANAINQRGFSDVYVIDPHSDVVTALVDNVRVVSALDCIKRYAIDWSGPPPWGGVIAPDGGAEKRALAVATWLNVPLRQAWKNRDVATGKITGFGCEPLTEGNRYLLVDDLCDGGGTFLGLAGAVTEDVQLDLYVSHGVFSKGLDSLKMAFETIITTDSLGLNDAVDVVRVAHQMKETQP